MMIKNLLWSGALLMTSVIGMAQTTVDLNPEQDNSMYSESSNSNGIGRLYAGQTCTDNSRRALIQFDLSSIPADAVITSVSLTLNCDNVSGGAGSNEFSLHRVSTEWGEGTSSGGGTGAAAIAPDANWTDAMLGTSTWTTAGGDFSLAPSAALVLPAATGDYTWSSGAMVSDIEAWIADPDSNFGWELVGDEGSTCTARRFGSKDVVTAPELSITYTCGAPVAICQNINVYLEADGTATIADDAIDGGSTVCAGDLTYAASQTAFNCDDIFDGPTPPSLVISGAYDGPLTGGTPKGVELYVINDIADLSTYGLGSANNGGGTDGEEFTFPAVAVSGGTYIYVASEAPQFTAFFGFAPDYTSGSMGINGDDAIELFHEGAVIDVFGDIDVDGSGEDWDYLDGWAHRVSDTGPDGATFTLANWTFSGINAFDGETSNATATTPFPVGTFTTAPTVGTPVTLTVTDEDMNTSTCSAAVMVFDTLAPTMSCVGAMTFTLDETGSITIDATDIDGGTEDGCGIDELTISETTFTCADVGEVEITLYATDIYGNTDSCTTTITIDGSEVITIAEEALNNPTCAGFEDGSIAIAVSGGAPAYTYDWDNDGTGDDDDMEDIATLGAGPYAVVVTDMNGCESTASFELTDPDAIEITTEVVNESCPGAADGSITILTIEGGTGPYTGDDDLTDLTAGTYPIIINDAEGCSNEFEIEVGVDATIDLTITETGTSLTANEAGATYQWLNCPDYTEVDGATEQTFGPTEAGTYACMITIDGGCTDTTDCVTFDFDSIEEEEALAVVLYPNPTNGQLNIQFIGLSEDATVAVLDIKGSVVMNLQTVNSTEVVDLSNVENGIYFVQIKTSESILTKKVTVKK